MGEMLSARIVLVFMAVAPVICLFSVGLSAEEINGWGKPFFCAVDWFRPCVSKEAVKNGVADGDAEKRTDSGKAPAVSLIAGLNNSNLPPSVKNVLEDPSAETARKYVMWRRKANEVLAQASDYIAQAEREMGPVEGIVGEKIKKKEEIESRGLVALYYFFSPNDPVAREDVKVLNKVWQEEQVGVVGIPVKARDEEVLRFVRLSQPRFPIRKGEEEARLISPGKTPDLYLALPLQKKIFRVGSSVTEEAIKEALGKALAAVIEERLGSGLPMPRQTSPGASGAILRGTKQLLKERDSD